MSEIVPKCEVKYNNQKYIIKSYDYDIQYFPYYNSRINQLKPILIECVHKKWGKDSVIMSLDQIADKVKDNDLNKDNESESLVIIGTLFKRMSLQPTILKELSEENQLLAQPVIDNKYISSDDTLWLQDGDENIELFGQIDIASHCTGICLALKGRDDQNNTGFVVEDICYASNYMDVKIERPLLTKDQFVAIVSGLGFSKHMNRNSKLTKALNILIDLMNGNELNEKFSQSKLISQLIIAGNCIGIEARKQESDSSIDSKIPLWNRKVRAQTIHAVKLLDKFLERLGQTINIDVMPGELDPTTQLLPQQPLHPCLFDKSYNFASIKCVTNPHCAHYNGIHFLGTSGQNIKSIQEYSSLEDPIEIMKKTLEWLHIAPTTPDTLHSYPFTEFDPFVITEYPDVYFVGNQEKFNYGTFDAPNGKKVLLISVPVFELEMICVLINLRSLNCEIIALN